MATTDEHDLTITRTFEATPAEVYACLTTPEYLQRWSTPEGYAIVQEQGEIHAGSRWRICMRGPDGKDLWLGGVYRELVPGRRVVYTHAWEQPGSVETVVDIELREHGDGTVLTFQQDGFESQADRDGHAAGWSQCFDKLASLLEKNTPEP